MCPTAEQWRGEPRPTVDAHYSDAALVPLYDVECGWSADRDYYRALPHGVSRIADLGCGTGLLAVAYAQDGHSVTGIDPAPAMLRVARTRVGGDLVDWVQGDARALDGPFDLIVMTGHAFQVLLTDAQIDACFSAVAQALAADGRFVFETRNPVVDWADRWQGQSSLATAQGDIAVRRDVQGWAGALLTFTTYYNLPTGGGSSTSTLRFAPGRYCATCGTGGACRAAGAWRLDG